MLVLGSVAASHIGQGWVGLDDTCIDQALQRHDMARVVLLKPLSAESKRSIVLIDYIEETSSLAVTDWDSFVHIELPHVVTAVQVFVDVALSGRAESFNGVLLAFHHSDISLLVLDNVDTLASVNFVPLDAMTTEVFNALDWERVVSNRHFEGLHGLLDLLANLREGSINTSCADASVCGFFDGLEKGVVSRVEGNSEGAVSHQAVDVRAVVDLHHVVVLKDSLVSHVRSIMGCAVVQTGTSGEGDSRVKPIGLDQSAVHFLNPVGNVHDFHTWADPTLSKLTRLPVDLSRTSELFVV